ncbi:hypothetical protein ACWC9S_27165 [Streptomyces xiamenensis]
MQNGIAVLDAPDLSVLPAAWIGEDVQDEDERDGWADGPEDDTASLSQGLDDDVADACAVCGRWNCSGNCPTDWVIAA